MSSIFFSILKYSTVLIAISPYHITTGGHACLSSGYNRTFLEGRSQLQPRGCFLDKVFKQNTKLERRQLIIYLTWSYSYICQYIRHMPIPHLNNNFKNFGPKWPKNDSNKVSALCTCQIYFFLSENLENTSTVLKPEEILFEQLHCFFWQKTASVWTFWNYCRTCLYAQELSKSTVTELSDVQIQSLIKMHDFGGMGVVWEVTQVGNLR